MGGGGGGWSTGRFEIRGSQIRKSQALGFRCWSMHFKILQGILCTQNNTYIRRPSKFSRLTEFQWKSNYVF